MNNSSYKIQNIDSDTIIISFSGLAKQFGGIPQFEFLNFLNKHFIDINKHFYIDNYQVSYHKGINGLSTNIDETIEYLKNEIKNYKNVIFLGNSAGGYAAILFGSLLNINTVIAFIPQTILRKKVIDEKYRDINKYINNTTKYYLYADLSVTNINDHHHISHCERISHHPNVFITKKENINLRAMRDNGELYDILSKIILNDIKS